MQKKIFIFICVNNINYYQSCFNCFQLNYNNITTPMVSGAVFHKVLDLVIIISSLNGIRTKTIHLSDQGRSFLGLNSLILHTNKIAFKPFQMVNLNEII